MLTKVKVWALTGLAALAFAVALIGVKPASFGMLYQPEVPPALRK